MKESIRFNFSHNTIKHFAYILREGLYAAYQLDIPEYLSKFSKKEFTLPQLFAIYYLVEYFRKDRLYNHPSVWGRNSECKKYTGVNLRNIVELIRQKKKLQIALNLTKIPHYSTLSRAQRYLSKEYRVEIKEYERIATKRN